MHYYLFFQECAELQRYASEKEIFHERSEADHFYLIQSGEVVLQTSVSGHGSATIQTLQAGEPLGWSWLFPPRQWRFSATASEPTVLIAFDATCLRTKMEKNRDFGNDLIVRMSKTLVERLQGTRTRLLDLYRIGP